MEAFTIFSCAVLFLLMRSNFSREDLVKSILVLLPLVGLEHLSFQLYTVELSSEGVRLYRIWFLPWSDVRAAQYYNFFGLAYAHVFRRRGFGAWLGWWIPAFFEGEQDFLEALAEVAPDQNPLQKLARTEMKGRT
jgi:hypothetical protein